MRSRQSSTKFSSPDAATAWLPFQRAALGALVAAAVWVNPAAAVPVVSIAATPDPAVVGSPVALTVLINGVADLYTYQFSLAFNPAVLQATSVTEGAFLPTGGTTFFSGGTINNSTGLISFAFDSLIGSVPGVSGNGALAKLNFNVIRVGTSALNFSDVLFLNSAGTDLLPQIQNRTLQTVAVIPEPAQAALLLAGLLAIAAVTRRRQV